MTKKETVKGVSEETLDWMARVLAGGASSVPGDVAWGRGAAVSLLRKAEQG